MAGPPSVPALRVVLDTNVLYGQFPRYMLLSLAVQGVLVPVWSPTILDELTRVLVEDGFDPGAVAKQRRKLEADWPTALVGAPLPSRPPAVEMTDPDDWPVVATAVVGRAAAILTWNRKHFPPAALEPYGLAARTPDRWCADRLAELQRDGGEGDVYAGLRAHRRTLTRPAPWTAAAYREMMRAQGFTRLEGLLPPGAV